jgi:hypothetical protein
MASATIWEVVWLCDDTEFLLLKCARELASTPLLRRLRPTCMYRSPQHGKEFI